MVGALSCGAFAAAAGPSHGGFGPADAAASGRCGKIERGTRDRDHLIGSRAADLIQAGRGRDRINGLEAGDCLHGGRGRDRIEAGHGHDVISAGQGADAIGSRDGDRDVIHCGAGNDKAFVDAADVVIGCERVRSTQRVHGESQPCVIDPATMTAPGCKLLRNDTSAASNPEAGLWGHIECESSTRYSYQGTDGDPRSMATGAPQPDTAYRRETVLDGDDFWGERCELGRNQWQNGENRGARTSGTFALYGEGQHKITFFSQRYPSSSFTGTGAWQAVYQNKQTEPYGGDGGNGVALDLQVHHNRLYLEQWWQVQWTTPAPLTGTWIRYALDVVYSADPAVGSVKLYVDANGDGDWLDSGEQSPTVSGATLARETVGGYGIPVGGSIPSHARIGLYHDVSIPCGAPTGCVVETDNVQVLAG
jgi:hypothetical protein